MPVKQLVANCSAAAVRYSYRGRPTTVASSLKEMCVSDFAAPPGVAADIKLAYNVILNFITQTRDQISLLFYNRYHGTLRQSVVLPDSGPGGHPLCTRNNVCSKSDQIRESVGCQRSQLYANCHALGHHLPWSMVGLGLALAKPWSHPRCVIKLELCADEL